MTFYLKSDSIDSDMESDLIFDGASEGRHELTSSLENIEPYYRENIP